jgi:hypothetical protein
MMTHEKGSLHFLTLPVAASAAGVRRAVSPLLRPGAWLGRPHHAGATYESATGSAPPVPAHRERRARALGVRTPLRLDAERAEGPESQGHVQRPGAPCTSGDHRGCRSKASAALEGPLLAAGALRHPTSAFVDAPAAGVLRADLVRRGIAPTRPDAHGRTPGRAGPARHNQPWRPPRRA